MNSSQLCRIATGFTPRYPEINGLPPLLFLRLVIAGFPARLAVEQPVIAEPWVDLRLAQAAVLLAIALVFRHFALRTVEFLLSGG